MADHEAQELARRNAKNTLLRVELPAVAPEVGKGLGEVGDEIVFHLVLTTTSSTYALTLSPIWDSKHLCMAFW
jgi:hypothetical protein